MLNTVQCENRINNTHQMQDDKHMLPSHNANDTMLNSKSSINLEHDYCKVYSKNSSVNNSTYYIKIV